MSESERVEQMRRDAQAGGSVDDELTFHVTDGAIGPSSNCDPDSAVRITKLDTDLFSNVR